MFMMALRMAKNVAALAELHLIGPRRSGIAVAEPGAEEPLVDLLVAGGVGGEPPARALLELRTPQRSHPARARSA